MAEKTTKTPGARAKAGGKPVDPLLAGAPAGAVLIVTGPARGRWRAGRRFGPIETRIPLADLSQAEIEAIKDDPMLRIWGGVDDTTDEDADAKE